MTPPLSLAATAAAVGLSASRFGKVWRSWVRDRAFPAPIKGGGFAHGRATREPYAWDAAALATWKAARSSAGLPACLERDGREPDRRDEPANDRHHALHAHPFDRGAAARSPALNRRLAAERAEALQFLTGA